MTEQQNPWVQCEVHTMAFDGDCEYCDTEMDGKQAVLNQFHEAIQETNQELQRMTGTPYIEASPAVAALKADVIVEMIFQDPKARMAYELNFANALKSQIEAVRKHMIRQQIAGGAAIPPGPSTQKILREMKKGH